MAVKATVGAQWRGEGLGSPTMEIVKVEVQTFGNESRR